MLNFDTTVVCFAAALDTILALNTTPKYNEFRTT